MSLSQALLQWHAQTLEPERARVADARQRAARRRQDADEFIAALPTMSLADRDVRAELARTLAPLLTPERTARPLHDVLDELELPQGDDEEDSRAVGVAREHLRRVWDHMREDLRDRLGGVVTAKNRAEFLGNVTLDSLGSQPIFTDHLDMERDHHYQFLHLVLGEVRKARRLRPRRHDGDNDALDPSLEWLTDKAGVDDRVRELATEVQRLALDHRVEIRTAEAQYAALNGWTLRQLADRIRAWDGQPAMPTLNVLGRIEAALEDRKKELLDRMAGQSQDEFVRALRADSWGKGPIEPQQRIPDSRLVEVAIGLFERDAADLVDGWMSEFARIDKDARTLSTAVAEGLDRVKRLFPLIRFRFVDQAAFAAELECRRKRLEALSWSATATALQAAVEAATKPPSAVAALTQNYSWRRQVESLLGGALPPRGGVVSHPEFLAWQELEEKSAEAVSAKCQALATEWRRAFADVADELVRLADLSEARHQQWLDGDRRTQARRLYEFRLKQLRPGEQGERRVPGPAWRKLVERWTAVDPAWWTEEEVGAYQLATSNTPRLVLWSDIQRACLMRQWTLLTPE